MIYELLPIGKENRISAKELCTVVNLPDKRALCNAIRKERINGALILSTKANGGGYYRAASKQELGEYVERLSREAKAIYFMLKASRKELEAVDGQIELKGAVDGL